MSERAIYWLTFAAALSTGLSAGLFFAFSNSVMTALGRVPAAAGIAAMQQVNAVIQNPLFFLVFFGPALLSVVLIAAALLGWGGGGWTIAAGLLYLAGIMAVTIVVNVPMNQALEAVDPASAAGAALWADYLARWTFWNHVRTASGAGALACYLLALR